MVCTIWCMVRSTLIHPWISKKSSLHHPNASRCRVPGFPRKADDPTDAHKEEDETSPGAEDCEGPSPRLCIFKIRNRSVGLFHFLQSSFYIYVIYVLRPYTAKSAKLCNWESNRQSASAGVFIRNLSWNKHDHSKSFVSAANELLDRAGGFPKQERAVRAVQMFNTHPQTPTESTHLPIELSSILLKLFEMPMTHVIQLEDPSKYNHLQIEAWTLTDLQYLETDSREYSNTVVFVCKDATCYLAAVRMCVCVCVCG